LAPPPPLRSFRCRKRWDFRFGRPPGEPPHPQNREKKLLRSCHSKATDFKVCLTLCLTFFGSIQGHDCSPANSVSVYLFKIDVQPRVSPNKGAGFGVGGTRDFGGTDANQGGPGTSSRNPLPRNAGVFFVPDLFVVGDRMCGECQGRGGEHQSRPHRLLKKFPRPLSRGGPPQGTQSTYLESGKGQGGGIIQVFGRERG